MERQKADRAGSVDVYQTTIVRVGVRTEDLVEQGWQEAEQSLRQMAEPVQSHWMMAEQALRGLSSTVGRGSKAQARHMIRFEEEPL